MTAPDERRLHHLTVTTRHRAETRRADVAGTVVDQLLPVIDAEGGMVPGMPHLWLDVWRPLDASRRPQRGAAFFQIDADCVDAPRPSKTPVLMGFAAWVPALSASTWDQVRQSADIHRRWLPPGPPLPKKPPPLPWLAVFTTPTTLLLPADEQMALGDLGRCVAWALLESE